jgi:hypothetical protein
VIILVHIHIDGTKQFKFINVKEVCILFHRHVSDLTVQFNPCLDKLCISMFNHDYPDKETNTTSAMGLDTTFQATESLKQSYISPPSYQFPTRDRSVRDNTDLYLLFL